MGISLQQYRAAIGSYAAGRIRKLLPDPTPIMISTDEQQKDPSFKAGGSWKLHCLVLIFVITSLICQGICIAHQSRHTDMVSGESILSTRKTCVVPTETAVTSHMSRKCLLTLLLIGGIEPNPGPNENITELDIIADLCVNTTNKDIKGCLRSYDPQHTLEEQEFALNKSSKATINATLEYLGVEHQPSHKKPQCVTTLVCRIQNLLPDMCNICETEFCIGLEETPLLNCEVCGQGAHDACVLDQLGIAPERRAEFGPEDAIARINPMKLKGWHYLCKVCEEGTIPVPDSGLLKTNETGSQISINSESEDHHDDIQDDDVESDSESEAGDGTEHDDNRPAAPANRVNKDDTRPADPANQVDEAKKKSLSETNQANTNWRKNVCRYYVKGTCRHGIQGRNCPKEHPSACKKLIKHGNKGPHGCQEGKNCESFHPKMCRTSLSKKECYRSDCKLTHVAGTRRKEVAKEDKPSRKTPPSEETDKNHFLEALRALETRMVMMDQRLATVIQNSAPQQQPRMPQPQGVPMATVQGPQQMMTPWQGMYPAYPWHGVPGSNMGNQGQGPLQQPIQPMGLMPRNQVY